MIQINRTPQMLLALLTAVLAQPAISESAVVEITAPDGVRLAATYTAAAEPGPGVLLLHMCNSDRSAWANVAELLAARGIHSLALDYRGFGRSGGERAEGSQRGDVRRTVWPADIDAAFELLRSRQRVDPSRLGAAGGSCGVDQAVRLAMRHPGEVQVLALLAGGTDAESETFLAENPWLPVLGVASHDDGTAIGGMRWTLGFSSHPANRLMEYPQGGHGTELFAVHADLEPAIADWFAENLVEHPVERPEQVAARPGRSAKLLAAITAPGGLDRLLAARTRGEELPRALEVAVNREGYRLLQSGEPQRAIEVLQFNVDAFPLSANALDSLGDGYLAAGEPEKAAALARRTIDAIPNDPGITEATGTVLREAAQRKLAPEDSGGD